MGSHYLVDNFHSPIGDSSLIDVKTADNGQSLMNGTFVVNVQCSVAVKNPVDLNDLITQKYAGILASYAGFATSSSEWIVYDDFLDPTGVDTGNVNGVLLGERQTTGMLSSAPLLQSTVVALPASPTQAVVIWEVFRVLTDDPVGGRTLRTYDERPSDDFDVDVSFDNGANFNSTSDGAVLNIPVPQQGNQFIIRFQNTAPQKRFIASWSVIF